MAHFLTLVLVDPRVGDPASQARALMRPYFSPDLADAPDAKCDGFVIGGRYDGDIWGKEQHYNLSPAEFQVRYGFDVVEGTDNIRPVRQLRPGLVPYAVVTPEGDWHDRTNKSDSAWAAEVERLLEGHQEHLAVAIDCHC